VDAGQRERDAERAENLRLVLDDLLRRAAGDGKRVDRDDEQGDEQDPGECLEEAEEPPADRRDRGHLDEVGGNVEIGRLERDRDGDEGDSAHGQLSRRPEVERQGEPDQAERERHEPEREEGDVAPFGQARKFLRDGVVDG
jgi:hypothetical protein